APTTEIRIETATFPLLDGGTLACGAGYEQVNVIGLTSFGGQFNCPTPIEFPARDGQKYEFDLIAVTNGRSGVAKARCSATGVAGQSVAPQCSAVPLSP